jgi:hypothetical protein
MRVSRGRGRSFITSVVGGRTEFSSSFHFRAGATVNKAEGQLLMAATPAMAMSRRKRARRRSSSSDGNSRTGW